MKKVIYVLMLCMMLGMTNTVYALESNEKTTNATVETDTTSENDSSLTNDTEISKYSYTVSDDENFTDGVMSNPDGYEGTGYETSDDKTEVIYQSRLRGSGYNLTWGYELGKKVMYDGHGNRFGYGECKKVIDVSQYNGNINWSTVKNTDVDGAILRITSFAGGTMHEDEKFAANLSGCRNNQIPFGIYMYSYATNTTKAANEANYVVSLLNKYGVRPSEIAFSVYYDLEGNTSTQNLSVDQNAANVETFVNILSKNGYPVNVYSYTSYLNNNLNSSRIHKYVSWVAQYGNSLTFKNNYYKGNYGWQYRSNGTVSGINGEVDVSCFSNYYGYDTDNHINQSLGKDATEPLIEYRANCQSVGWLPYFVEPNTAGTTGRSLPLYQLSLKLKNVSSSASLTGTVITSAGTENYGNIKDGTTIGRSNAAMRQVKFTLSNVPGYHIEYRVHSADIGWQAWVKQGNYAGNASKDIQAIDFRLVRDTSSGSVSTPKLTYQSHVQNAGWQNAVSAGGTSGTSGRSLRLEAMKINLSGVSGSIQYRTHVQNIGWQNWVSNGQMTGTTGRSLRLEAIQIQLTGEVAKQYDIYYRVHAQNIGWMGWAKNGASAGTAGYSYRLEAIQIKLVPKGTSAPGSTSNCYQQRYISYQTHVQNIGWQSTSYDGAVAGTSGRSLRLESIKLSLSNPLYSGSIQYRTHVQNIGWQGWVSNGQAAGTTGRSLRLEAIQIKLTGEMANHYDVYYRVHAQNFGWMGWTKNGASAGSAGYAYRMEAIQVVLVPKGSAAPGSTANPFRQR